MVNSKKNLNSPEEPDLTLTQCLKEKSLRESKYKCPSESKPNLFSIEMVKKIFKAIFCPHHSLKNNQNKKENSPDLKKIPRLYAELVEIIDLVWKDLFSYSISEELNKSKDEIKTKTDLVCELESITYPLISKLLKDFETRNASLKLLNEQFPPKKNFYDESPKIGKSNSNSIDQLIQKGLGTAFSISFNLLLLLKKKSPEKSDDEIRQIIRNSKKIIFWIASRNGKILYNLKDYLNKTDNIQLKRDKNNQEYIDFSQNFINSLPDSSTQKSHGCPALLSKGVIMDLFQLSTEILISFDWDIENY